VCCVQLRQENKVIRRSGSVASAGLSGACTSAFRLSDALLAANLARGEPRTIHTICHVKVSVPKGRALRHLMGGGLSQLSTDAEPQSQKLKLELICSLIAEPVDLL